MAILQRFYCVITLIPGIDWFMKLPREECYRTARNQEFSLSRNLWDIFTSVANMKFTYSYYLNPVALKTANLYHELEDIVSDQKSIKGKVG